MKTKLSLKDKIFLSLAFTLDAIDDVAYPLRMINQITMSDFYDYGLGKHKKPSSFYTTLSRGYQTGELTKQLINGEVNICLTSRGYNKVESDFPLLTLQNKPWDKKWRLVIFDIPEKQRSLRENFRRKLKELGFGMVQKSVWVSPHDITTPFREYLEFKKLNRDVYLLEIDRLLFGNPKSLAEKIWPIWKLVSRYREILFRIKNPKEITAKIIGDYFEILLGDPFLPLELLPQKWPREIHDKMKSLIKKQT